MQRAEGVMYWGKGGRGSRSKMSEVCATGRATFTCESFHWEKP
jgi:hypothetical protein